MTGTPPTVSEQLASFQLQRRTHLAGRKAHKSRAEAGAQGEGAGHLPAEPRGRPPAAVHAAWVYGCLTEPAALHLIDSVLEQQPSQ